ncbi:hypothetical protein GGD81_003382 [Rhodobium orientis]|uniref:DUF2628 domain-containing protein n=1 Tax=Rhodobium orientis TaxID=34017 RepID=A0A327JRY1_9HYPH|nr:DUF2628 domain-containing protein [Rhodobium orientis]MBB4304324.1 hypothetical protein [Rhodobium orientis]MBK5948182.1 hypothetical protein [Rhodobium orientis]RAI28821.1 hypothetical protein CH339_05340 [Rhodobium orientis]
MAAFMVMIPPASGDPLSDAVRTAFVKDGFSWVALFFAPLWALYHGLWLVLGLWIVVSLAIGAVGDFFSMGAGEVLSLAFSLLFALEANQLRRWTLQRRGWELSGIVVGRDREDYERRYFDRLLVRGQPQDETIPATERRRAEPPRTRAGTGVIGSMPTPRGA